MLMLELHHCSIQQQAGAWQQAHWSHLLLPCLPLMGIADTVARAVKTTCTAWSMLPLPAVSEV